VLLNEHEHFQNTLQTSTTPKPSIDRRTNALRVAVAIDPPGQGGLSGPVLLSRALARFTYASREIVLWLTLYVRAMSTSASPFALLANASCC
jgi:hypothetical protein